MSKKYNILFRDTIIFALGSLGSKVILFFLVPLYTNYLSTEEYGIADLVFTTAQLLVPIVSIVIYEAVIRYGLMKGQNPAEVLKVSLVIGSIGSFVTIAATPLFNYYNPIAPWKWYLCAYVILNFNANILKSYLKVKDKNKTYAVISVFQTFVMAISSVIFIAILHTGVQGYLVANIIAAGAAAFFAAVAGDTIYNVRHAKFNKALCVEMIKYSTPLILNDLSWWAIHSSDKIMIEAFIGASTLGLYTVASKIPSLINVMISIFGQAWGLSSIREIESSNDTKFYTTVFEGYMYITFGACIVLVAIIKPFMMFYVGQDFRSAWIYVPALLVSAVFSSVSSYYGQMYGALKKSVNSMLTTLSGAVINIVVNYVLIQLIGIWGAVFGTVAAYVFLAASRMIDVGRYIKIDINFKAFLANCLIIAVQSVLVSRDTYIIAVSIASLVAFLLVNRNTTKDFIRAVDKRFK